jgi:ABC-type Fe3+ transport system substrate-binding protein
MLAIALAAPYRVNARTVEDIANLSGPDRQAILEQGARQEGELLWVGSFNEDNARPILAGFAKRYPFIKVNRVRTDSTKALQRVLAELRARSARTDLITSNAIVDLREAGAVQAFDSPSLARFAPGDRDSGNFSAPLYFVYYGMAAYNTGQVTPAQAPKTYDDLLDPKWKGQMTFASSSSGALFFISFLRMQWGDAKATAYLEKLAAQKIVGRTESARTVLGMVTAGEHKIMINPFLTHVGEFARKGGPLDVAIANPTPVSATPVLLAKSSPHPHATMLLIDYLLGPEAQGMLRDAGYFPANPDVAPAEELKPYVSRMAGFSRFIVDDTKVGEMTPETSALYQRLFE